MKTGKVVFPMLIAILTISLGFSMGFTGKKGAGDEKHPKVDFSMGCVECHTDATPDIVAAWKGSKHGLMRFGCYLCHGDGKVNFYPKPDTQRCIACHSDILTDYSKTVARNCFDCHHGHMLKFHQ